MIKTFICASCSGIKKSWYDKFSVRNWNGKIRQILLMNGCSCLYFRRFRQTHTFNCCCIKLGFHFRFLVKTFNMTRHDNTNIVSKKRKSIVNHVFYTHVIRQKIICWSFSSDRIWQNWINQFIYFLRWIPFRIVKNIRFKSAFVLCKLPHTLYHVCLVMGVSFIVTSWFFILYLICLFWFCSLSKFVLNIFQKEKINDLRKM